MMLWLELYISPFSHPALPVSEVLSQAPPPPFQSPLPHSRAKVLTSFSCTRTENAGKYAVVQGKKPISTGEGQIKLQESTCT